MRDRRCPGMVSLASALMLTSLAPPPVNATEVPRYVFQSAAGAGALGGAYIVGHIFAGGLMERSQTNADLNQGFAAGLAVGGLLVGTGVNAFGWLFTGKSAFGAAVKWAYIGAIPITIAWAIDGPDQARKNPPPPSTFLLGGLGFALPIVASILGYDAAISGGSSAAVSVDSDGKVALGLPLVLPTPGSVQLQVLSYDL